MPPLRGGPDCPASLPWLSQSRMAPPTSSPHGPTPPRGSLWSTRRPGLPAATQTTACSSAYRLPTREATPPARGSRRPLPAAFPGAPRWPAPSPRLSQSCVAPHQATPPARAPPRGIPGRSRLARPSAAAQPIACDFRIGHAPDTRPSPRPSKALPAGPAPPPRISQSSMSPPTVSTRGHAPRRVPALPSSSPSQSILGVALLAGKAVRLGASLRA